MARLRSATFKYILLGTAFGFMFPVLSTLGELYLQRLSLTWHSVSTVQAGSPLLWVIDTAPLFLGVFAGIAGRRQDEAMQQVTEQRKTLSELEKLRASQRRLVDERTADLTRRNLQLEMAARIARDATAIHGLQQLLDTTVSLISDRFGFYHSGIFLLDESRSYAVLRAASSSGGRRMLAHEHKLRVGKAGIVGNVTAHGRYRIAMDVGTDPTYFDNPYLPDTRSEIALPLRIRDDTIGALDVQSLDPNAFGDDDVIVLQALADQIAIAIYNARLLEQARESLEAERRAYGRLGRESWQKILGQRPDMGYRHDPRGLFGDRDHLHSRARTAAATHERVLGHHGESPALTIPIVMHEQVIGTIDALKPAGARDWNTDEIEMLESLTEQVRLVLDGARLHQESQRRVAHEQAVGAVTRLVRGSLDVDTVLQTAVREIGEVMGLSEVQVRIAGDKLGD